jgi:hypothetical protein
MDKGAGMIAVTEFITRLDQGYAEAFLCRADDLHLYVVKSRRSGKASLIREWVCGRIGVELGLPIPPFSQIYADRSLAAYSGNEDLAALADTPGFGSRFVIGHATGLPPGVPILNAADVATVDVELRKLVLLFDWWVLNFDRTDDNPNLLRDAVGGTLHVIDHNLAFDLEPPAEFWLRHIFRKERTALSDPGFRAAHLPLMDAILGLLPRVWSEMPDSWTEVADPSIAQVDTILRRCLMDEFWCP